MMEFLLMRSTTSITDFPVFGDVSQYKGFDRVSGFLSWFLTFIYSGQLANEVAYTINSNAANLLDFIALVTQFK